MTGMEDFKDRIDSIKFTVESSELGPGGSFSAARKDIISQQLDDLCEIFDVMKEKCRVERKEISRLKDKLEHAESALRKAEQRSIRHGFVDLYNYNGFEMEYLRFKRELARGQFTRGVVAYFDLDGFKQINDCLGHDIANDLLIELGDVIKSTVRPIDVAACLHGDEFAILFPDADEVGAGIAMKRIEEVSALIGTARDDYQDLVRRLGKEKMISFTPGFFVLEGKANVPAVKDALHAAESKIPKFAEKREGVTFDTRIPFPSGV